MKMPDTIKRMLVNKYVLYLVFFLSITNVHGYLASQDFNALTFFVIVSFLTTYFSKNMIIVLVVGMVSTNFLSMSNRIPTTFEGLENKVKGKQATNKNKAQPIESEESEGDESDEGDESEKMSVKNKLKPASLKGNKVNYKDTIEAAYDNIDKILDSGAVQKMTKDTDQLMARQDKLAVQIEKFAPLINQAQKMIEKLPMDKMTSMINKLGGMGVNINKKE